MVKLKLNIIKGLAESLPVDNSMVNRPQQVSNIVASLVKPVKPNAPKLLHSSEEVAEMLGIEKEQIYEPAFLDIFSGSEIHEGTQPYAMNYGGHQFGHWAGQLGDGRAINLFDVKNHGHRWTLQLKGAGPTPYSRTADGFAVLRSSIREYLCSEAMFHLGVPTTRALSLVKTGDQVLRDVMYDGHPDYEPGAIVCRVAPSFIRFGNFEIHTTSSEFDVLQKLTDFTIKNYYPENKLEGKEKYITFFKEVSERTMQLMLEWHRVGFVHGVMNTDNMS
ncbi:MAG TPA: protein adenylyltransferase SelO family protein, partial [Saprospiraceae bacterium]|nr:protein adenylyltransferase SelO family protein [Saprospiraceae bacterium]